MARALLVIDMLNDFVDPAGSLYVGPTAPAIIERVHQEIIAFQQAGDLVIYICDQHRSDDQEFTVFSPHCIQGTVGAQVYHELKPLPEDVVIPKRRYSAFYGTDLDLTLRERGVQELVLVGVCTNICVLYTAADARMREYKVSVLKKAVTSFNQEAHAFALGEMTTVLGVKIIK